MTEGRTGGSVGVGDDEGARVGAGLEVGEMIEELEKRLGEGLGGRGVVRAANVGRDRNVEAAGVGSSRDTTVGTGEPEL